MALDHQGAREMKNNGELKPQDMNEDQRECYDLLCDLVYGEHHITGLVKACGARGIMINTPSNRWATYDFDGLTRLVVMAHDRCIRAEICPGGPGRVGIHLHKRKMREGQMHERHPTMEENIARIRGK
jgi:hypothetical protein